MKKKPTKGISVDGGCSGNPGQAYYRAVDISTGEEIFRKNIGIATNNIAEFLALCHAIHYISTNKTYTEIYTDSTTAMTWVKNKKTKSTFKGKISLRLKKAEVFLNSIDYNSFSIKKWDTKSFGEIPADFGLK